MRLQHITVSCRLPPAGAPFAGRHCASSEVAELKRWASRADCYIASGAMISVSGIEPELAVDEGEARIAKYLNGSPDLAATTDYGWAIRTYAEILVVNRAPSAGDFVKRLQKWLKTQGAWNAEGERAYLASLDSLAAATDPATCSAATVHHCDRHYMDPLLRSQLACCLESVGVPASHLAALRRPPEPRCRTYVGY